MEHTDEDHVMSADQIVAELGEMGIDAERRSIYPDIDEINKVLYMLDQGCTMEDAEADLEDPELAEETQTIVYKDLGRKIKGYYARRHKYDLLDLRLLAECAYSSRFLTESQSNHLIDDVIKLIAEGNQQQRLIDDYDDHELSGDWKGHRELHILPDWLLIYYIQDDTLVLNLSRTGTHSDLFKK